MNAPLLRYRVSPGARLGGAIRVPGDKSISHRALMLGGIADGETRVRGFLASADCLATMTAMRALGVRIARPRDDEVIVQGAGKGGLQATNAPLDMGNAGTAIRLSMGLLCGQRFPSTLIGDASDIYPRSGGLVVDAAGEAIVSGQTIGKSFPTAPGPPFASTDTNTFFVLKLDATGGKLLAAVRGIGGLIALDNQGSIYIAGIAGLSYTPIPVTQGAFQPAYQGHSCSGGGQILVSCTYQYVTKLNAGLTQIVYSTYVTGSWGAAPAAVGVDAQGSVLLAGITHSPDYPTTSGAFEPAYFANAPAPPQVCLYGCISPPPASGYVTKLNATGTALVDSTFFSGSQSDTITFAAFTSPSQQCCLRRR